MSIQTDGGVAPLELDIRTYEIPLTMANMLLPDSYILDVGAHEVIGQRPVDWVPRALDFSVLDVSVEGEDSVAHNTGLIRATAVWEEPTRVC